MSKTANFHERTKYKISRRQQRKQLHKERHVRHFFLPLFISLSSLLPLIHLFFRSHSFPALFIVTNLLDWRQVMMLKIKRKKRKPQMWKTKFYIQLRSSRSLDYYHKSIFSSYLSSNFTWDFISKFFFTAGFLFLFLFLYKID